MEKVKIIIDSSSDLTLDEIEKYNLEVIPLTINIDGEEYDYRTIGNEEYIIRMRTAKEFSTSQPAIGKYIEAFEKWTKEGYKILVLTISSALSGTYNSVLAASSDFNNIYVVDTKTTTRGMVYLLESAIEQINNDISLEVVADNLREQVKNIYTFVTIDNLDNLVKGGRLSKASALIGNLLNILDPEIVVVGGGVALAGDFLFDKVKEKIKETAFPSTLETLKIVTAKLGNDAGILGAAYLGMQD